MQITQLILVAGSLSTLLLAAAGCKEQQPDQGAAPPLSSSSPAPNAPPPPPPSTTPAPSIAYISICAGESPDPNPAASAPITLDRTYNMKITPIDQVLAINADAPRDLAGLNTPCVGEYNVPIKMKVSRKDAADPVQPYMVYAGPLADDDSTGPHGIIGKLDLDRADWSLKGELGRATIGVQRGWAAMVRPTGFPPLRTIRITTGRPAWWVLGDPQFKTALVENPPTYAVLVAVEPKAAVSKGVEYIFMRKEKPGEETTLELMSIETDGKNPKLFTIKSGEYARFDRKEDGEWKHMGNLPTATTLRTLEPFVLEAVCGAYKSSGKLEFFDPSDAPICP